jgi:hypothetical protein
MRLKTLTAAAVTGTLALLIAGPLVAQGGPGNTMGERGWGMWWGGP